MKHYSKALFIRLIWLGFCLVATLSFTMIWFDQISNSPSETSVFKPSLKISQLKKMNDVLPLEDALINKSLERPAPSIPCSSRGAKILKIRVMETFALDVVSAENFLENLNQQIPFRLTCSEWIEYLQTLGKFRKSNILAIQVNSKKETLDEALTERVSWNTRVPCVYFQSAGQLGLAVGNPVQCLRENLTLSHSAQETSTGMRKTIQLAKNVLVNSPAGTFSQVNQRDLLLTIDPTLQDNLDKLGNCLSHRNECKFLEKIPMLKHVSVVIMAPNSGDILATLCWSGPCDRFKNFGNLGAFLVETPPASTAKLMHAMVIAESGNVEPLMLQRQIKTSGQTDSLVNKRNEWWEKQAICDGQASPCTHPQKLIPIAKLFSWDANCKSNDLLCGRLSLFQESNTMVLPGFVGKIKVSNGTAGTEKMLSWKEYDEIREGKKKSPGSSAYFNTALSVQSSIGAGDSRTSALGLAHLSGQIYQMSKGQPLNQPRLIKQINTETKGQVPSSAQQKAAQTVIAGMRKVVEPTEKGWSGPGTASGALQREFQQACLDDCGLWAKTGTVSQKDPGFKGATLFTGVMDLEQLSKWRHKSLTSSSISKVSIGVIVHPQLPVNNLHIASELAMHIASELSLEGVNR